MCVWECVFVFSWVIENNVREFRINQSWSVGDGEVTLFYQYYCFYDLNVALLGALGNMESLPGPLWLGVVVPVGVPSLNHKAVHECICVYLYMYNNVCVCLLD